MKTLMITTAILATLFAAPTSAGSNSPPRFDAEVTAPLCPLYSAAFGLLQWRSCASSDSIHQGSDTPTNTVMPSFDTEGNTDTTTHTDRSPRTQDGVKTDNSDAGQNGGNKHNRTDKDKPSQEIAETKKGRI